MADKTTTFCGLHTALIDIIFLMALRAVYHLQTIPRVPLNAGNIFTPDIPPVTANPIRFIYFKALGFSDVAMAGDTIHPAHFDMVDVGEEYAIRLPGENQQRHFSTFGNILGDIFFLLRIFPIHLLMTVNTLCQRRYSGIGTVFPD